MKKKKKIQKRRKVAAPKARRRVALTNAAQKQQQQATPFSRSSDYEEDENDETDLISSPPSNDKSPSSLLTKEEEAHFALALRTMRQAIRVRDELVRHQHGLYIHPTEDAWAHACGCSSVVELRRVMSDGQEARSRLVKANVGLVTSLAKKHYQSLKFASQAGTGSVGTILTLHDMIQEGNLGLMEAAERFEPEKGFRFSTYAVWWIRQRILRSISDSSRTIRLPAHVHGMLHKMRKARNELMEAKVMGKSGGVGAGAGGGAFGVGAGVGQPTTVSAQELAQHLGVSEEKVLKYTASSRNVVSLEVPIYNAQGSPKQDDPGNMQTLGDTLASDAPTPDEDVEMGFLRQDVWTVMQQELSDAERNVILHRFGFLDDHHGGGGASGGGKTVAETAAVLNISNDRVRLIEARALNKLRHPQRNYRLREYVGGIQGGGSASGSSRRGGLVQQRRSMRHISHSSASSSSRASSSSSAATSTSLTATKRATVAESNDEPVRSMRKTKTARTTREEESSPSPSASSPTTRTNTPRPDRMWFF